MKPLLPVGAFLVGVFLTIALSAVAQTKPATPTIVATPHWTTAVVDGGVIYQDTTIGFAGEQMSMASLTAYQIDLRVRHDDEAFAKADEAKKSLRANIFKKIEDQKSAFLEQGYEPFSAAVYASSSARNEEVWFFRKRTN